MRLVIAGVIILIAACGKPVVGARVVSRTAYVDLGNGCRLRCWGVEYQGLPYMHGGPGYDGDVEIVGDKLNCAGKDLHVGALACFDKLIPLMDGDTQ